MTLSHRLAAPARRAARAALTVPAAAGALAAQTPATPAPPPPPVIVVAARGEARVTPDRALLSFGTETRRATAAGAAQENARIQRAVIDTARALGIPADDIATAEYGVYPDQQYDNTTRQARIVGYVVRNTVRVRVTRLDRVGPLIDAVLAKGANGVNGLELSASNTDDARRTALAEAMDRARRDADAIARAAGGAVLELLEATTQEQEAPVAFAGPMVKAMAAADAGPTPVQGGAQTISARVVTRWRFAPVPPR